MTNNFLKALQTYNNDRTWEYVIDIHEPGEIWYCLIIGD